MAVFQKCTWRTRCEYGLEGIVQLATKNLVIPMSVALPVLSKLNEKNSIYL